MRMPTIRPAASSRRIRRTAPPAWAVLPLELAIEPADQFASWLAGRLAAARRRRIEAAA